ncbi:MAG: lipocalin family protein [Rufibacter sp.]
MKPLYSLLLLVSFLSFSSCSDDDEGSDHAAQLVNKRWVFTELKVSSFFGGETDLYAEMEDCEKDNQMEFQDKGVLLFDEGASKCDPNDELQTKGTWAVSGDKLTVSGLDLGLPGSSFDINITESSATTLKGTFAGDYGGIPFNGNLTLTAQ